MIPVINKLKKTSAVNSNTDMSSTLFAKQDRSFAKAQGDISVRAVVYAARAMNTQTKYFV